MKRWGCYRAVENRTGPGCAEPQSQKTHAVWEVKFFSFNSAQTELVGKLHFLDLALSLGTWAEHLF